jgi:transketolase
VEQIASLRAMPGLLVLRPGDANEVTECYRVVMESKHHPAILSLSRQALPTFDRTHYAPASGTRKGAYVLADAEGGPRRVTLLATGSEVALASQARTDLQAQGIPTAVVSMPCWELFERQPETYRTAVLGPDTVRIGIEAAVRFGWDRYLGSAGGFIGMNGFGASGPAGELFRHFGITSEAVVAEAKRRCRAVR